MSGFNVETVERKNGRVAICEMDLITPNNTFSLELMHEFLDTLHRLCKDHDGIIVCSANEKFFSNGLDGAYLLAQDKHGREKTIFAMIRAFGQLVAIEKPWIAEIQGYAMAGGAVVAMAADNRYMAGRGRIGFSELLVGLPLPVCYTHGIHRVVDARHVRSVIEGTAYKPDEALEIGMIDGIADSPEKLREMSLKRLDQIFRLEQTAYLATRKLYRGIMQRDVEHDEQNDMDMAAKMIGLPQFEEALKKITGKNQ